MKRCPECRRDYYDDSLLYCLDDGTSLLEGPASGNEPATAILHETAPPREAATKAQIHLTAPADAPPSAKIPTGKGFDKRLILAGLVLAVIAGGGFVGYRYFKPAASEQISSIAVLPFENRSGDPDSEYLSDGLAESLIYRLSQIPEFKVSPRSSVFRYKGQDVDPQKVGTDLGVDAVMSGRMVQRGDSLTISVDLVEVRNNKTLWGEQYERKMSDLLATQREIAAAITQKLQLKLSGDNAVGITKRYTESNDAYQHYLQGRFYWNRRTAESLNKAIEQFRSATESDPNFALAFVGLADCYGVLTEYAGTPSSETLPQAKTYAERALSIDPNLAEAHTTLAFIDDQSWQWPEAENEFKRSIELNPNYPTTYHWYSIHLRDVGRYDDSMGMIRKGYELDPLSSPISINVSRVYQLQNNTDASIENTLKLIELDPNYGSAYQYLGLSYTKKGRFAEAVAALERAAELTNRSGVVLGDLGYVYGVAGKRAEALAVLKELEAKYARREAAGQFVAHIYAALGENEKVFEWLEKDFRDRDGGLPGIRWQLQFESLRDDPRFKDLLKRMNSPD